VHDVTKHVAYLTGWRYATHEARFPLVSDVSHDAGLRRAGVRVSEEWSNIVADKVQPGLWPGRREFGRGGLLFLRSH
jgi:hypothetical protein